MPAAKSTMTSRAAGVTPNHPSKIPPCPPLFPPLGPFPPAIQAACASPSAPLRAALPHGVVGVRSVQDALGAGHDGHQRLEQRQRHHLEEADLRSPPPPAVTCATGSYETSDDACPVPRVQTDAMPDDQPGSFAVSPCRSVVELGRPWVHYEDSPHKKCCGHLVGTCFRCAARGAPSQKCTTHAS